MSYLLIVGCATLLISAYYFLRYLIKKYIKPVDIWNIPVNVPSYFEKLDHKIRELGQTRELSNEDYSTIFRYFVHGIHSYSSPLKARIIYPGVSGTRGSAVEGLEGFARTSCMLATWLVAEKNNIIQLDEVGIEYNLLDHLRSGVLAGTDPDSVEYWGDIVDYDQRIVEATDIALCLWITKSILFDKLSTKEKEMIISWLKESCNKKIYGGNWLLFKIVTKAVLTNLDDRKTLLSFDMEYEEFKSFYVGDGWFTDGKDGELDYYNAWQMHYMLFWLSQIEPSYDSRFIDEVQLQFAEGFQYFISTEGFPPFGRSMCYRLAISTPLIIAAHRSPELWARKARRALDVTWSYFIKNGALEAGRITQGYFEQDEDLLENYSGRASPLWSLRSMVIALYSSNTFNLCSKNRTGLLPIEIGNFDIPIKAIGYKVLGDFQMATICIERHSSKNIHSMKNDIEYKRMSALRKVLQQLLRRPLRISNMDAKYKRNRYCSSDIFK